MSTKIRIDKIRKRLFVYMLGMFLVFSTMSQTVQANEEQSEIIENEPVSEEVSEEQESEESTPEMISETLESTQILLKEELQSQDGTQITPEETTENPESEQTASEEMTENQESEQPTSEEESETQESTQTEIVEEQVKPQELDLGDYLSEMVVGDKQLLAVTVLPINASSTELSYSSSNTEVATVNGMGRITALKKGKTNITVTCENVSETFELTITEAQSTEIEVTELDLGECPKEITIGTSQLLSVAVIPADATNIDLKYKSSNSNVVSVNALGRLTGKALGTAEITVSCGKVQQKFQVTVVEDKTKVEVTDLEIGDYEDELKVDAMLTLSVTVLPKDATDTDVTYKSSDTQIATVNSSGEVKGIAPGEVTISVSAGKVTKQVQIKVKIATKAINLNGDYLVMKPNATFQIEAQVQPSDAPGEITYKSMDTKVAEVSATGRITAKSCGNTVIAVSNGDLQVSVNVIVNEESISINTDEGNDKVDEGSGKNFPDEIHVNEYPIITTEMLKYFYEKEKVLTIRGEDYTIYLDGKDIVNFENELETKLLFQEEENGLMLVINNEKKLCGKITIDISNKITDEKYLYLYNDEKEKYQSIKTEDISLLHVDTAGKYLITAKKLLGLRINIILIVGGCMAVFVAGGIYIGVKKKYWFW